MNITYYLYYPTLVLCCIYLISQFKNLSGTLKWVGALVCYTAIHEILIKLIGGVNFTLTMYWIYTGLSCLLYLNIIKSSCQSSKRKTIIGAAMFFTTAVGLVLFFKIEKLVFPSNYLMLTHLVMVISCLFALYDFLQRKKYQSLKQAPEILVVIAILIYTSVSFTHLSTFEFRNKISVVFPYLQKFHVIFSTIFYTFLTYSLHINIKKNKDLAIE